MTWIATLLLNSNELTGTIGILVTYLLQRLNIHSLLLLHNYPSSSTALWWNSINKTPDDQKNYRAAPVLYSYVNQHRYGTHPSTFGRSFIENVWWVFKGFFPHLNNTRVYKKIQLKFSLWNVYFFQRVKYILHTTLEL